jgi:hypothetical protein
VKRASTTEWDRLWKAYVTARAKGDHRAIERARRAIARYDAAHGLRPLRCMAAK